MKKGKAMVLAVALFATFSGMNVQAGKMGAASVQQMTMMKSFIEVMRDYMAVSRQWVKMMKDDDMVIYFVAESTAEIFKAKGAPLDAIPELRALAAKCYGNPVAKKAIMFKIKDIYKEAQKYDEALKVLKEIVKK